MTLILPLLPSGEYVHLCQWQNRPPISHNRHASLIPKSDLDDVSIEATYNTDGVMDGTGPSGFGRYGRCWPSFAEGGLLKALPECPSVLRSPTLPTTSMIG